MITHFNVLWKLDIHPRASARNSVVLVSYNAITWGDAKNAGITERSATVNHSDVAPSHQKPLYQAIHILGIER